MKIALLSVACSFAVPIVAQAQLVRPTHGMLSSLQIGMVFTSDLNVIARKEPGLPAKLYDFDGLGRVDVPEYTAAAIESWVTSHYAPVPALQPLQFDGMSTGNDLLPLVFHWSTNVASQEFRIHQPPAPAPDWAAIFLALESDGQNDGADVVGYYFSNPGFPQYLRNTFYPEILRAEYETGSVPSPAASGAQVAALDAAMGIIETTGGAREPGIIERFHELYFSLTPSSALALGAAIGANSPTPCDGATIFRATYDLGNGAVLGVDVFLRGSDLELDSGDDVDALAVGYSIAPPPSVTAPLYPLVAGQSSVRVLFSTVSGAEQLMVYATPNGAPGISGPVVRPLRNGGGNPLVGPAGTLSGNVKGVCAKDPETGARAASFGIPSQDLPYPDLGLSLHARAGSDATLPGLDSFLLTGVLSGWGAGNTPHNAMVFLAMNVPGFAPTLFQLPNRTPANGTLEFQVMVNFPWQFIGYGPNNSPLYRNEYSFYVVTVQSLVAPYGEHATAVEKITRQH